MRQLTRHRGRITGDLPPAAWLSLWPESWLVIKSRKLLAVQRALSLHSPHPCSWLEAFACADAVFVAPPVQGWILVSGAGLPSPDHDVDACFRFILGISRKLGHVQFFSASRSSHHHAWVKARQGKILRAYAWAGQPVWQQGAPTSDELKLGVVCLNYACPAPADPLGWAEVTAANVEKVPLLAARWGVAPEYIQQHLPLNEWGIVGQPAPRY